MGSSSTPDFKLPNIGQNLSGVGGAELEAYARNMLRQGLDPNQRKMLEGSAAGSLRSGEQNQRELFASMGNVPVGAQVGAQTQLRGNVNKGLLEALYKGDINAKQQGFQNWTQLGQMASGITGQQNQYALQKSQLDNQPGFWEGLLQSIVGGGSNVLSSYLQRPGG